LESRKIVKFKKKLKVNPLQRRGVYKATIDHNTVNPPEFQAFQVIPSSKPPSNFPRNPRCPTCLPLPL
jgi:hypothetical protein